MGNKKYDQDDSDDFDSAPEEEPEIGNRYYNERALERESKKTAKEEKRKRAMCMVRRAIA